MNATWMRCPTYGLENPDQPNLLRSHFPYTAPPAIFFDGVDVPVDPAPEIYITDTTFRDGQQARPPYTPEQIAALFGMLARLSGPKGVIRQSEFFLYTDSDKRAVELCRAQGHRFPEITAWIRANPGDLQLVKAMEIAETGILTSVSDYHIYLKLGLDRKGALEKYTAIVKEALVAGIRPRCHLEDVTRADIYGFVVPFVQALVELGNDAGIPVKVRLCDTMGYGLPYPGTTLPRSVPRLIHTLRQETGIAPAQLEWHGHNDFYKGFINATTAWLYGCAAANGTILGFGERTGNTPIEGLIFEYVGLTGDTEIDTRAVTAIARYLETECGYQIPPMTPFVGRDFNLTRAGIHADGLIKNEEIYTIFDTQLLLDRDIDIAVTDKSGAAGIALWVNRRFRLSGERAVSKHHPGVQAMAAWVRDQYSGGRTTSLSDDELVAAVRRWLPSVADGQEGRQSRSVAPSTPQPMA